MTAEALHIDADDASDLIVEVEACFGIKLGQNLTHIVTVGDLHDAIMREIGHASGGACPTSRAFYRLRRSLGQERVPPSAPLRSLWTGSPRSLREHIRRETRWDVPGLYIGWLGCGSLIAGVTAAVVAGWQISGWLIPPALALEIVGIRLDRGIWAGEWETIGLLARRISAMNFARLAETGARQSPVTVWHALIELISGYGRRPERIDRRSSLCG